MFADIVKILGIPLTCSKCQLSLRKNILEAVKSLQQFCIYFFFFVTSPRHKKENEQNNLKISFLWRPPKNMLHEPLRSIHKPLVYFCESIYFPISHRFSGKSA